MLQQYFSVVRVNKRWTLHVNSNYWLMTPQGVIPCNLGYILFEKVYVPYSNISYMYFVASLSPFGYERVYLPLHTLSYPKGHVLVTPDHNDARVQHAYTKKHEEALPYYRYIPSSQLCCAATRWRNNIIGENRENCYLISVFKIFSSWSIRA